MRLLAVGALAAIALLASPGSGRAVELEVEASAVGGGPASLAGSHPEALRIDVGAIANPRNLELDLPAGLIENPQATPRCSEADFSTPRSSPYGESRSGESCPADTQVGTVEIVSGGQTRSFGLFNLDPPPGAPARIGAAPFGAPLLFVPALRQAEGGYGLTLRARNLSQILAIAGIGLELWGVPWSETHDGRRGQCLNEADPGAPHAQCPIDLESEPTFARAYLTLPASCAAPPAFAARLESWAGARASAGDSLAALGGCAGLDFSAGASVALRSTVASAPSGLGVSLTVGQAGLTAPAQRLSAPPRRAVLELPAGLTINPAVGSGLDACTQARYEAEGPVRTDAGCPNPSRIGAFTVSTPLLAEELTGGIYLATPYRNPFGSQLAVYLVARAPVRGAVVKVAGRLDADPRTGRLTATFEDLPQLPYTNLSAEFRQGQRAPLSTPEACGRYTARVTLWPWSDPARSLVRESSIPIREGLGATGACPEGAKPFAPGASAGALNPDSGSSTEFYLRLTRSDAEQEITSYSAALPRGITGALAGIPFCSDAAIEAAKGRSGREEEAEPSCPAASQIGRTFAGYGVGLAPAYAPGRMYLAGPYGGAALSLVAIDSAAVGPFDLGTVVIRSALRVDPLSAQLSIDSSASDPIPHILGGIPLRLRDIRVHIDRPGFAINPTSCEASEVVSTLGGSGQRFSDPSDDTTVVATNLFQLSNCSARGFAPRLGLRLRGSPRRGAYPALRAVFAARPGDANLRRVALALPGTQFLAQNHIRDVCTRAAFAAERCPAASVYGRAVVWTPLLDGPLSGPVYLRSSDNPLPDLVIDLRQGAIRIVLAGRIDSIGKGRIRASFENLPDARVSRFVLQMRGGRRGLLVNSADLCRSSARASARLIAQNNKGRVLAPRLRARCGKGKRKAKRLRAAHRRRGEAVRR